MATTYESPEAAATLDERLRNIVWSLSKLAQELEVMRMEVAKLDAAPQLVGVSEAALIFGVKPATISTWVARGKMPEPLARLAAGPVWSAGQLEAMARMMQKLEQLERQ